MLVWSVTLSFGGFPEGGLLLEGELPGELLWSTVLCWGLAGALTFFVFTLEVCCCFVKPLSASPLLVCEEVAVDDFRKLCLANTEADLGRPSVADLHVSDPCLTIPEEGLRMEPRSKPFFDV